jgi:enolase
MGPRVPMATVTHLEALEIIDCRGVPTLEVSCVLDGGVRGNAAAPTSSSAGPAEVAELRDGDEQRHRGLGCRKAVALVEGEIRAALVGKRFGDQAALDKVLRNLDGTANRSKLGGNTSFAVSLAFARAHAAGRNMPLFRHFAELVGATPVRLPAPMFTLFSHSPGETGDRGPLSLSFTLTQAASIDDALSTATNVRRHAEQAIRRTFDGRVAIAPDGGFEAPFYDTKTMLTQAEQIAQAAGASGVEWVLRGAGARRYDLGWYRLDREKLTAKEVIDRIGEWGARHPIAAVIDPLGAEDWGAWKALCERASASVLVASDDLTATHLVRVEKAAADKAARAIVIKPSQAGSLTDAARTVRYARKAGLSLVVSGRSGETEDDWIADLAVGWNAEYLHAGPVAGSERLSKYNRLLAIEKKTRWPIWRRGDTWPPRRTTGRSIVVGG